MLLCDWFACNAPLPAVFVAWLAWVFVHLFFLVTYRNRLVVFTKWAWAWFTFERASRLIWQGESPEGVPAAEVAQQRRKSG